MHRIFSPVDNALFDRLFHPIMFSLEERIGLTRAAAACLCIDAAIVAWLLTRAASLSDAMAGGDMASAAFRLSVLLVGLVALLSLRLLFRRVGTMRVNPLRASMVLHRAVILVLIIGRVTGPGETPLWHVADLCMLTLTWAALYLGACSAPPAERRVNLAAARGRA